ncbi:MAG: hypothetical protein AAF958_17875 [Planctomycetota bacterium]
MPSISDPNLFEAVYLATKRSLSRGNFPNRWVARGNGLVRLVDKQYLTTYREFDASKVVDCLRVWGTDSNHRFSGSAPLGIGSSGVQHGAVYFSTQHASMLNEMHHYAKQSSKFARNLKQRGVIESEIVKPLTVLDLSRHSGQTLKYLDSLGQDADVKRALASGPFANSGLTLTQLVRHTNDYSAARAIGLAVGDDRSLDGITVETARPSVRDGGESGDNVVLYGPKGEVVSRRIEPQRVILFDRNVDKNSVEMIQHSLG